MKTTFILAKNLNMTPFDVMAQDVEEIIMVLNYLIESGKESTRGESVQNEASDKEQSKDFWACL